MRKEVWKTIEFLFSKPWLASIFVGLGIHGLCYIEEYFLIGSNYFSRFGFSYSEAPLHTVLKLFIPFFVPFLITTLSRKMVLRKEVRSLLKFPQANPDMVMKIDAGGNVAYSNPAVEDALVKYCDGAKNAAQLLPPDFAEDIGRISGTAERIVKENRICDTTFQFHYQAFPDEDAVFVSGRNITDKKIPEDFVTDAIPLIYRTDSDGKIQFLGGGFPRLFERVGADLSKFDNFMEILEYLGADGSEFAAFKKELNEHWDENIARFSTTRKIQLSVLGEKRWYEWVGTRSTDGKYFQGQLFDIHDRELLEQAFSNLRRMTYGSEYLGERVARGLEQARTREMTVMFVDMVNSTARIVQMNDEDAKQYSEEFSAIITEAASVHQGFVDKFMGDGAMLVFGLETQDGADITGHKKNAVAAGIQMLKNAAAFNEGRAADKKIELRVGLESGKMKSGVFNNDKRMIFTSMGLPVITAARLESKAPVNSILVTSGFMGELEQAWSESNGHNYSCSTEKIVLKGLPDKVSVCTIIPKN